MRCRWLILGALGLAACGGHDAPPPPPAPPRAAATSVEAVAAGPDDLVVATVDGHPVWGSCVEAQARALGLTAAAALDQCVSFELLAQAADARALRADPEVVATWRREMVRALIKQDLGPIDRLEALPPDFLALVMKRLGQSADVPPLRGGHYARVEVARDRLGGPDDEAAHRAADAAYAELKDEPGVLPTQLRDVVVRHAAELAPTRRVSASDDDFLTPIDDNPAIRGAVPAFREALWKIPELGRISPPVRTKWGWDIILFWDELPAMDMRPRFFESVRSQYFLTWSRRLGQTLGVTVTIDEEQLAALAQAGP